MKKLLSSIIAVVIGMAFVTTGFAQENKAPTPPQDQSVSVPAPEKAKAAIKKPAKKKKKSTKKAKKARTTKPAKKAEPATAAAPAEK
jgi:hypothetical protein